MTTLKGPRVLRRGLLAAGAALSCLCLPLVPGAAAVASPVQLSPLRQATNQYPSSLQGSFSFYSGADTNIATLWQRIIIPAFNRTYPHIKINYVLSEHGANDVATLDRVAVAVKDHRASGYALLESGTNAVELGARQGLFIPVTTAAVPNSANVPKAEMAVVNYDAVPYRGSKVVLAYNSKFVPNPPKTLSELISWIVSHPGKFAYCNPTGGGSGQYFIEDVLDSYMSPAAVAKLAFSDVPALEKQWAPGMAELHKLNADVYGNGTYPTGNTQVLALLASGAAEMATVWSDQGTQALKDGQLPSSVKLGEITPPFAGSPVYLGVPRYTPQGQVRLVDAFLNFVLSVPVQTDIVKTVDGFPGVSLAVMPQSVRSEFGQLGQAEALPYSADVVSDMERVWQQDVP
ncbi:MAG: extracellular solute-binding protein [Acidimicrobiales bacterium]